MRRTQLASLRSVVVSGAPPLASRICKRVSGKSRPASEDVAGAAAGAAAGRAARAGGGAAAGAGAVAVPSRSAFSCAAFCARSRLSASIFSLIAARAFLSFSFSVGRGDVVITTSLGGETGRWEMGGKGRGRRRTAALFFEVLENLFVLEILFDLRGFLSMMCEQRFVGWGGRRRAGCGVRV